MRPILAFCLAALLPLAAAAQSKAPPSSAIVMPTAPTTAGPAITPAAGAPAPAEAPKPVAPAPISPEAMQEARALTDMLGIPAQAKAVLQQVRGQVIQATINASGKSVAEASAIADEIIMPDFQAKEADLAAALVAPWAIGFTPAELRDLRAFYATSLGRRLLATMPQVTQQSVQIGQQWMQTTFRDSVAKHADELHAKGLKF